ncbi:hypothetical protein KJZ61_04365 [Candidatus Dependentiae bacterium]|nr:hypothetical protein [Candidatus Dependentiae bacterium]
MIKSAIKKYFLVILCFITVSIHAEKVGLCVVATGKYTCFIPSLLQSARKFFCTNHEVTYFIFTDGVIEDDGRDVVVLPHDRFGWPYDTMFRYYAYWDHRSYLQDMDYIFACDADMLFVDLVGDEIFGSLVGTLHPGYIDKRGTYEIRRKSTACVLQSEGEYYFAGGFYGGVSDCFFKMIYNLIGMMESDLEQGIVAVWHDESYLNRYFVDHKPSLILPRAYCARSFDYPQRLVALVKDHNSMRA